MAQLDDLRFLLIQGNAKLGAYRFNWSVGEAQRLRSDHWLDAEAMRAQIARFTPAEGSGDIYARLPKA